jgi:hypothetical protein
MNCLRIATDQALVLYGIASSLPVAKSKGAPEFRSAFFPGGFLKRGLSLSKSVTLVNRKVPDR